MEIKQLFYLKQTHLFFAFCGFFCLPFLGKDADPAVDAVVAGHDLQLALAHEHDPLIHLGLGDLFYLLGGQIDEDGEFRPPLLQP
jgi:hypothetical protein